MKQLAFLCVPLLATGGSHAPPPAPFEVNTHQMLTALAFGTSAGFERTIQMAFAGPDLHMGLAMGDPAFDPFAAIHADADAAYYWTYMLSHAESHVADSTVRDMRGNGSNGIHRLFRWASLGAVFEDFYSSDFFGNCDRAARSRVFSHFFDEAHGGQALQMPLDRLLGLLGGRLDCAASFRPVDAQTWGQRASGNDQRLELALPLYRQALTARTKEERRDACFRLLRVLGQCAHLLQDMCQPSHTRNDPHPPGNHSALEDWCARRYHMVPPASDDLIQIDPNPEDMDVILGLVEALGRTPDKFYSPTIDDYFVHAASFSGRNFYSDDTIDDTGRPNPAYDVSIDPLGWEYRRSRTGANAGCLLSVTIPVVDLKGMRVDEIKTIHDPAVLRDNARWLLRKAAEVSQSFYDNFFRGQIEIEARDERGSGYVKLRNTCNPEILRSRASELDLLTLHSGGTLSFYYWAEGFALEPLLAPITLDADLAVDATKDLDVNPAVRLQRRRDGSDPGPRPISDAVLVVFEGSIGPEAGIAFAQWDAEYVEPQVYATVSPNLLRNAGDDFDVKVTTWGCVDHPLRVQVGFDIWTANGVDLTFWRDGRQQTERHALSVGAIQADREFGYDANGEYVVPLRIPSILYVPPPNPFYSRAAAYSQMAAMAPYRFLSGSSLGPSFPALLKVTERAGPDRVRIDQTLATRAQWQNNVRWSFTLLPL